MRRAVGAGSIGDLAEQFDYGLYGCMAPITAPAFLPERDKAVAVLGTYAITAVACLSRPPGGTLVGRRGGRVGRRRTLPWTHRGHGRRPMPDTGSIACIVLVPVAFRADEHAAFGAAAASRLIHIVPEFSLAGIVTVRAAELLSTRARFSAIALAYNSSFSILMGLAPFAATLLVDTFDTIHTVRAYLAVDALPALVVVSAFMTETYRSHLGADEFARRRGGKPDPGDPPDGLPRYPPGHPVTYVFTTLPERKYHASRPRRLPPLQGPGRLHPRGDRPHLGRPRHRLHRRQLRARLDRAHQPRHRRRP
ncbi:hypothetical protein [Streptomyces sp. NEAU-W12]|uniref:hypothetical protein n=1 Tax=Streptomyces sp. NEAU-W12 TaxID=2994668 RepID=UPI00224AE6C3|nr:hypothetical protein [Streptomyces sp. NEAU-W12]MCX2925110.1 hypothetical protein [Streptomyces sp. NEAU-W12]